VGATNAIIIGPSELSGNFSGGHNIFTFNAGAELTIATGVVTATHSRHKIDTEADAATDDLDTITAGVDGQILKIRPENDARDVVVKHNTGNIRLNGSVDFTMDRIFDNLTLMYDTSAARWLEQSRSNEA